MTRMNEDDTFRMNSTFFLQHFASCCITLLCMCTFQYNVAIVVVIVVVKYIMKIVFTPC